MARLVSGFPRTWQANLKSGSGRSALGRSRRYLRVLPVKRGRLFPKLTAFSSVQRCSRAGWKGRPNRLGPTRRPIRVHGRQVAAGAAEPHPGHVTPRRLVAVAQPAVVEKVSLPWPGGRGAEVDARSALSVRPAHRAGARRRPRPGRRRRRRIRALVPWRRRRNRGGRAGRHRRSCLRSPRGRHRR